LTVGGAFLIALLLNIDKVFARARSFWREGGGLSVAWVLMFLATGLWTWRESAVTGIGSLDASAKIQVSLVGVASFLMIMQVLKGADLGLYRMAATGSFLVYGLLAFLSAGVSPAPALTIYKSGLILSDSLLVVIALSLFRVRGRRETMLELTYSMGILFLCGIVAGGILFPDIAVRKIGGILGYNLNGAFPVLNANDVGFFAAIAAAIGLRRLWEPAAIRGRLFWGALSAMGFVVLFFSQARTSLVALVIVLVMYAVAIKRMRLMAVMMLITLSVIGAFYILTSEEVGFENATLDYLKRGQSEEMVESMSGREGLWQKGFAMFSDSPLIGHGFEAGVKYGGKAYGIAEGLHMHNAHMQVLVNSGLLGYVAWMVFILAVALPVFRRVRHNFPAKTPLARYEVEMFGVVLLILLRTMTGSVLVFHHCSLLLLLSMLVYIKIPDMTEVEISNTRPGVNGVRPRRILATKHTASR